MTHIMFEPKDTENIVFSMFSPIFVSSITSQQIYSEADHKK